MTLAVALALCWGLPATAFGADELTVDDSIGDTSPDLLNQLGFNPNSAMTDVNTIVDGDYSPYGENAFTLTGFDELFVQSSYYDGGDKKGWYNNSYVYDSFSLAGTNDTSYSGDPTNNVLSKYDNSALRKDYSALAKNQESDIAISARVMRSSALDANGDGRDNYVAQVYAIYDANSYTDLYLRLVNAETGTVSASIPLTENLPFYINPTQAGAYLNVTCGDFDGDGIDEVAAYDVGTLTVKFYKPDVSGEKPALTYMEGKDISIVGTTGMNFDGLATVMNGNNHDDFKAMNALPVLDMCTMTQSTEAVDDLVLSVSYSRQCTTRDIGTDINKSSEKVGSRIVTITNPLTDHSTTSKDIMQWSWGEYGSTKNQNSDAEIMMFCGVDCGDIDNDGTNELVVGGYRLDTTELSDSDMDVERFHYMATYFDYSYTDDAQRTSENGTYGRVQLGQWVPIDSDDYNNDTDLDDGIYNDGGDQIDVAYNPLSVTCFVAQGSDYADSVCIGGIVARLGSQTSYGSAPYVALANNSKGKEFEDDEDNDGCPEDDLSGTTSQFQSTGFVMQYALQLKGLDQEAFSKMTTRCITESVAGNFDNNTEGREQIAFTYTIKQDGDNEFSTYLGMTGQRVSGDVDVHNYGGGSNRQIGDGSTANVSTMCRQFADEDNPAGITVAAVDVDHDSQIVRLEQDKEATFYFSNPKTIAILQADPAYGDILGEYENLNGGTSFTKSKSTSESHTEEVSISAGLISGFSVGVDLIVTDIEAEFTQTISASAGYAYESESTTTSSMTFTTHQQNQVGLVMTPYVRYYYEIWSQAVDEEGKPTGEWGWHEMTVDVPRTPQTSIITTETYDSVAQEYNDALGADEQSKAWTLIDGNILTNTEGDVASYPTALPKSDDVDWETIAGVGSVSEGDFIGVGEGAGEITRTLSYENATSNGITWGSSIEQESTISIRNGPTVGNTWSVDYSGSYSWGSTSGVEYGWTVSSIPRDYYTDYSFRWSPIIGTATLNAAGRSATQSDQCVVVGYLVKDVNQRLGAPQASLDRVTSTSATIAWEPSGNTDAVSVGSYRIYRYNENNLIKYHYIGTVQATDPLVFTDTSCSPESEYTYVVQAVSTGNKAGIVSNKVTAITNPDPTPTLAGPDDASSLAGGDVVFTTTFGSTSTNAVQYQWQKSAPGTTSWSDISNANASALSLNDVTTDMNGTRYRCIASQMIGSDVVQVMSRVATLYVGTQDEIDLYKLKATLEKSSWSVPMATANDTSSVKTWVDGQIAALNSIGATVTIAMDDAFSAATAGTFENMNGTNGSFGFTATLSKGEASIAVNRGTGVITATMYDPNPGVSAAANRTGDILIGSAVTITATPNDIASATYAWYKSTTNATTGGELMSQTGAQLTPDTSEVGTAYYYCTATDITGTSYTSNAVEISVVKASPAIALSVEPTGSVAFGNPITLTATVSGGISPTGTVTFKDGETVLGTATLANGSASLSYTPDSTGSSRFSAVYGGDFNNLDANSNAVDFTVSKSNQTTLAVAVTPEGTLVYGNPAQASTSGGSGTGAVTYSSSDESVARVDAQSGAVTLNATGTFSIKATKAADENYNATQAVSATITVGPRTLTVAGIDATNRAYDATTKVAIAGGTLDGIVDGDTVSASLPTSGTVADANVGDGKSVTFAPVTISGDKAAYYTVEQPAIDVDITEAPLAVTADKVVVDKGQEIGALTVKVAGFVGTDTAENLTGYSAPTATPTSEVSTLDDTATSFPVTFSGGEATGNYTFVLAETVPLQINCVEVTQDDYLTDKDITVSQDGSITITPAGEYVKISSDLSSGDDASNLAGIAWSDSLTVSNPGQNSVVFRLAKADGTITEEKTLAYSIDQTGNGSTSTSVAGGTTATGSSNTTGGKASSASIKTGDLVGMLGIVLASMLAAAGAIIAVMAFRSRRKSMNFGAHGAHMK